MLSNFYNILRLLVAIFALLILYAIPAVTHAESVYTTMMQRSYGTKDDCVPKYHGILFIFILIIAGCLVITGLIKDIVESVEHAVFGGIPLYEAGSTIYWHGK